jgi:predicted 3-demethylubiquinone-9 3-methyltransferase (glyoxalase superfamily)
MIIPFLWFDKNAEEAMNFYVSVFAGQGKDAKIVSIKRYPEGPLEDPMKGMEGKVLTGVFELNGQRFMALDGGPYFKPTGAVSFYIPCKSQDEVDYFWEKLGEGGDPKSHQCGWLTDKYGFSWQIIPDALPRLLNDSDKQKADKAMKAMLKMKKIDISALEEAVK